MCSPKHFAVTYSINPWMDPSQPVDTERAVAQWNSLVEIYQGLGHQVEFIEPAPGLPDMVYAANGGTIVDDKVLGAQFRYPQRQPEAPLYATRYQDLGLNLSLPKHVNEGEGDFTVVGSRLFAGVGYRSDLPSHLEVQEALGIPVITLQLVNPRYYHLDTALTALSDDDVAYLPSAFSPSSLRILQRLFPEAILVSEQDAAVFGLNAVSDGRNVVVAAQVTDFKRQLTERGYNPIPADLSELLLGGGGVKCCTAEFHTPRVKP